MILYEIFPNKTLKIREDENTYITENLISSVHIKLPSTFGDYPVKELTAELRFYFPEGDYMAYAVDTQQARPEVPITNDITEKPQTLSVMLFFYKGGNVIGKTNSVDKVIRDAPLKGEPLTPRAEFDEVIAEQRATIAEQAETITEQVETISSQGEQITELSNEIEEIRELLPVHIPARLQSKEIFPDVQTKYYPPDEEYDGFSSVTAAGATVEGLGLNENYYKLGEPFLDKVGAYHPFPENSYGGIYFTELNENNFPVGIKVVNYDFNYNSFSVPGLNTNALKNNIKSFILLDCKNVNIADSYFNGAQLLTTCRFDGVLRIGVDAFRNCTSLTELTLPDSLTSIGNSAFQNCTSLTRLTLPDSLTSISVNAFYNCSSLTRLTLPDSLTSISNNAFYNCTSLTEISLPDSLTSISNFAFQNCKSLTELTLPDSLTRIGYQAFDNCTSLTEISLPNSLTSIDSYVFQYCISLTNLTLAQGFNCNGLAVYWATRLTAETIVACLEALADRTGLTAYTITFGSTNLNKLTAEQKAIATNKNWNLA